MGVGGQGRKEGKAEAKEKNLHIIMRHRRLQSVDRRELVSTQPISRQHLLARPPWGRAVENCLLQSSFHLPESICSLDKCRQVTAPENFPHSCFWKFGYRAGMIERHFYFYFYFVWCVSQHYNRFLFNSSLLFFFSPSALPPNRQLFIQKVSQSQTSNIVVAIVTVSLAKGKEICCQPILRTYFEIVEILFIFFSMCKRVQGRGYCALTPSHSSRIHEVVLSICILESIEILKKQYFETVIN